MTSALRAASFLLAGNFVAGTPLSTAGGPKTGVLNVHVVAHTHDDVGWLKTVDQYYSGQNNSIQNANVKNVLDTAITSLAQNPDRKFTYVEQAFFQRWWRQQNEATRNLTKRLVRDGQLSFVNGGWSMHDEATPHYIDMIDQTTTGHRFLMEEFGISPRVGWQIDPFGHSATQAALLSAEVGFTGLFFGRIDYEDLDLRHKAKACEFVWRASPSLGPEAQVFSGLTGEYGGNYGPPDGFDWDVFSNDAPVQDDPSIHDYNVKSRVDDFVAQAKKLADMTRGEHIMFTMGSDFQYQSANSWFTNLDKIIHYANKDGRVNAFYSTPDLYVASKAKEAQVSWPLKTDDFFPYADQSHQFWTGYFTSRPTLKRYTRESSAVYQMIKQLATATSAYTGDLQALAEAIGVMQHHDAVAGTEKQHVADDYVQRIADARVPAELLAGSAIRKMSALTPGMPVLCSQRNISVCPATQALSARGSVPFLVYNGLAQARTELVEIPVGSPAKVFDMSGKEVPSQLVTSLSSVTEFGHPAGGSKQTLLVAADMPALGFSSYYLKKADTTSAVPEAPTPSAGPTVLENEHLRVEFCASTNALCRITDKATNVSIKAEQSWMYYESHPGDSFSMPSGAYVFRPWGAAKAVQKGAATLSVTRGPLVEEAVQTFGPWVSQRVRLAKGATHVEITYTVGPIPIGDGNGKEVISRFSTDLQNAGESSTDSNGREMQLRKRDFRPSWKYNANDHGEPVAGNYYPVTTAIHARDAHAQLTILTDRAQAGTGSVVDGELELMVHRRVLKDDNKGVGEPLNETEFTSHYVPGQNGGERHGPGLVTRGQHFLLVGSPKQAAAAWRPQMDRVYMPPHPFFAPTSSAAQAALQGPNPSYSALKRALPANVQIVTLEPLTTGRGKILLRLAHQFGLGEDEELSKPATVDLAELLAFFQVVSVRELGLSGSISRQEVLDRRVAWRVEGEEVSAASAPAAAGAAGMKITLGPLQIRTFELTVATRTAETYV